MVTLRDLYVVELQDLLDAEQHMILELPNLRAAATSAVLQEFLDQHLEQTRIHVQRLELLLRQVGASTDGAPCDAMHGLLKEGRRRIDTGERGDVLDAALIGVAQRIEHYEIAAYGCARTYARTLGDHEAANLLQQTLDEEGAADARLTRIAERGINQSAGEGVPPLSDESKARLRYVAATSVREFKYREFRIRNDQGEDLGTLDGLIVDPRTGRPDYFVVDSGGWFVGQRYVVPLAALTPDERSHTLRTSLDRKTIAAYPPFSPDAFADWSAPAETTPRTADEYQPPTWLMTGVWMTEASGFASVPPRAQSDFSTSAGDAPPPSSYPAHEQLIARGEPEGRGEAALEDRKSSRDEDQNR